MKYYIECYRADGGQILGNLDGQAVLHCQGGNWKRTADYKRLRKIVKNPKWMNGKVDHAKVVTESGVVVETVT